MEFVTDADQNMSGQVSSFHWVEIYFFNYFYYNLDLTDLEGKKKKRRERKKIHGSLPRKCRKTVVALFFLPQFFS